MPAPNVEHETRYVFMEDSDGKVMRIMVRYLPGANPITNREPEYCHPGWPAELEILCGTYIEDDSQVPDSVLATIDEKTVIELIESKP